jgi:hypothetical protein
MKEVIYTALIHICTALIKILSALIKILSSPRLRSLATTPALLATAEVFVEEKPLSSTPSALLHFVSAVQDD